MAASIFHYRLNSFVCDHHLQNVCLQMALAPFAMSPALCIELILNRRPNVCLYFTGVFIFVNAWL